MRAVREPFEDFSATRASHPGQQLRSSRSQINQPQLELGGRLADQPKEACVEALFRRAGRQRLSRSEPGHTPTLCAVTRHPLPLRLTV